MHNLKSSRKSLSSPKSIDRILMIISENWDEAWNAVQQRSQATQALKRQSPGSLLKKSTNPH